MFIWAYISAPATATQFLRVLDHGSGAATPDDMADISLDVHMLFITTDSGATWKMVRNNNVNGNHYQIDSINITMSYATDKTIILTQRDTTMPFGAFVTKMVKSTDGGATWNNVTSPGAVNVSGIAMVDANTYWVGSTSGIRLNTSSTTVTIDGQTPQIMIPIPGFFLVVTHEGGIYMSTDNGVTFNELGTDKTQFAGLGIPPPPTVTFDPMTKTIYAVEHSSNNILEWTVGTSDSWTIAINNSDLPEILQGAYGTFTGLSLVNGTWYITQGVNDSILPTAQQGHSQIYRSLDITDSSFDGFAPVLNTTYDGLGGMLAPGPLVGIINNANGNPVYYGEVTQSNPPSGDYADHVMYFTDSLVVAPKTTAPIASASVATPVDFSWSAVTGTSITYDVQIAYDTSFASNVLDSLYSGTTSYTNTKATQLNAVSLIAGKTYYWRVRALKSGMPSNWSKAVQFTTQLTSAYESGLDVLGRISPANGATGVATNAALTWGTVDGATSYNLVLASDSAFTKVIDTQTGLTVNVYSPAAAFTPGTTYFWKVQAVSGTNTGNWVANAFTTAQMAASVLPGSTSVAPAVTTIINPTPVVTVNVAPPALLQ